MKRIQHINVATGFHWVAIPEVDLFLQCGCIEDSVKHLIQHGLITQTERDGINFETGPNAILLSDIMLQGGHFSNLAEFPVLQMLYHQGMGLPNHPNNSGRKPLLIGNSKQIAAQMEYIYRGNYGLISKEELSATGIKKETVELLWNMKMDFAFGEIKQTDQLLDTVVLRDQKIEIRDDVFIKRDGVNKFSISYMGETVFVDLMIPTTERYRAPYPLGFQDIPREYFAVVHSGQGDGWDINRPSMASILIYQGKIYLIDAGPNIAYCLIALGIGINEIEGIFHTHCHDDHFAGLPNLLLSDHRIKYYATPFVRASVFKKLASLLSRPEENFFDFFDVRDLQEGQWNNINGLEVRPVISPHPVETTILKFRTYRDSRYFTYAHLADIISLNDLKVRNSGSNKIPDEFYQNIIDEYLAPVDLKKIDIGTGMIHGRAEDFEEDKSERIVLAHTAVPLNSRQKEIGSSATFGLTDVLIKNDSEYLTEKAHIYLADYLTGVAGDELQKLLNNTIASFSPGTIILKRDVPNDFIFLLLTGSIERINHLTRRYNIFSSGTMIGDYYGTGQSHTIATYRAINFVHALKIPARTYRRFVEDNDLLYKMKQLYGRIEFFLQTWLFGEALSPRVQTRLAEKLHPFALPDLRKKVKIANSNALYLIESGSMSRIYRGEVVELLEAGDFFGENIAVFLEESQTDLIVTSPVRGFILHAKHIADIPIIRWKLLETHQKRKSAISNT